MPPVQEVHECRLEGLETRVSAEFGRMSCGELAVLDRISRVAKALIWLRLPALVAAVACIALVAVVLLVSESRAADRYLIPGALGLLWSLSAYSFIELFRGVPSKLRIGLGFFERLRERAVRALYWLFAVLFVCTTATVLFVTNRMVRVWLDEFAA